MISVAEAVEVVLRETTQLNAEFVPLDEALGYVLAREAVADMDLPPFDRAQMDGYAVRAADTARVPARLRVVGEAAAGRAWGGEVQAGEAVRIMTGAPVPVGADAVQQVELTREAEGVVEISKEVAVGHSVVPRGAEVRAGATVIAAGEVINSGVLAVLAAFGYAEVPVFRRPRVAVIATGSELVRVAERPGVAQIRDSNSYSLTALARGAGAEVARLPLAGDDLETLTEQIAEGASRADVLILSGGVSVGTYDFTKAALRALGAEIFFERVALKPGKPTVFARLGGKLIFGLPGNPVSVAVTFSLFARPALRAMPGGRTPVLPEESARLTQPVKGAAERASYLPATLAVDDSGGLTATPLRWGGSSDFVGFAHSTALIIVPPHAGKLSTGALVRIIRLPD
ncbi:MAG TPA: gephyrin-like molybdotransferase Glp [Pyrinomonadaceae bacterium]|nr:gephyrin-like molybdotransferase Glp [Pyrinomonadaceae bacterium]